MSHLGFHSLSRKLHFKKLCNRQFVTPTYQKRNPTTWIHSGLIVTLETFSITLRHIFSTRLPKKVLGGPQNIWFAGIPFQTSMWIVAKAASNYRTISRIGLSPKICCDQLKVEKYCSKAYISQVTFCLQYFEKILKNILLLFLITSQPF